MVAISHHWKRYLELNMTDKEREIYAMLLQLCFEILPKTSVRNNNKINDVLALIKEHLDGKK